MSSSAPSSLHNLIDVARAAIELPLDLPARPTSPLPDSLSEPRGVFVTLHRADGTLRGCVGHIRPILGSLKAEIEACAVAAASRDPRFAPVTADEVASLSIELSILEPPEPIASADELDPKTYGVVVRAGSKKGVLLPDLDGVDTGPYQLSVAMRKGGIAPSEPHTLERFRVTKVR